MAVTIAQVNTAADSFRVWVQKTNATINALATEAVTANGDANGAVTSGNAFITGIFGANTIAVTTALRGGNVQSGGVLTIVSNTHLSNGSLLIGNSTVNATINSSGFVVPGNSFVNAIFVANTAAVTTGLRGGTVSTSANLVITSNVSITGSTLVLGNVSINSTALVVNGINVIDKFSEGTSSNTTSGTSAQIVDTFDITEYRAAEYVVSIKDNTANGYQAAKVLVVHDGGSAYVTEYGVVYSNTNLGTFSANANSTHVRLAFTPTRSNTSLQMYRIVLEV